MSTSRRNSALALAVLACSLGGCDRLLPFGGAGPAFDARADRPLLDLIQGELGIEADRAAADRTVRDRTAARERATLDVSPTPDKGSAPDSSGVTNLQTVTAPNASALPIAFPATSGLLVLVAGWQTSAQAGVGISGSTGFVPFTLSVPAIGSPGVGVGIWYRQGGAAMTVTLNIIGGATSAIAHAFILHGPSSTLPGNTGKDLQGKSSPSVQLSGACPLLVDAITVATSNLSALSPSSGQIAIKTAAVGSISTVVAWRHFTPPATTEAWSLGGAPVPWAMALACFAP